ncbi:alpha-latrotoxin-Lhe1a-like [Gossypium australe]|uniref:Alpha-latrotoxin-Lhe1a-like n=1 Tax=Gossypium australe TaxID=47621 RepID=A0A5B6VJ87_9ROSI|nr:alpha-latrotoxin-Lhe1a-like [Gossypium australe]
MDIHMRKAALEGDVEKLYKIIDRNPKVLDNIDKYPVVETPLHVAASEGHTSFAIEIMRLKPSFSQKLDSRGMSPMHLALENNRISTVLRLLETENGADLVRNKGKDGITPLLHLVKQGDLHLLDKFLLACPTSIVDITNQGETALHIAVKTGNIEVLDYLLAYLQRSWKREALNQEERVLNWKDENGYTMVNSLLKTNINVNAENLKDLTVPDMVNKSEPVNTEMKGLLIQARALEFHSIQIKGTTDSMNQPSTKSKVSCFGNVIGLLKGQKASISTESRDALLVAGALIATTTFQAILSPPGGLGQGEDNEGKVVMKAWAYMIFIILNGTSFCVTVITISLLLPHGFFGWLLTVSLGLLSAGYLFSSMVISPNLECALFNLGLFILFVVLLVVGILLSSKRQRFISIRKFCKCSK